MVRSIAMAMLGVALAAPVPAADVAPSPTARAPVPSAPPPYVSALADYRPWREATLAPWARANAEAGRLGGHAGQLRELAPKAPPKAGEPAGGEP